MTRLIHRDTLHDAQHAILYNLKFTHSYHHNAQRITERKTYMAGAEAADECVCDSL